VCYIHIELSIIFGYMTRLNNVSTESKSLHTKIYWRCFMSIYVGNVSYEVKEDDLKQVFAEYGTVKSVQLPTDRETGRVRGFAFVEMGTDAEETAAIDALDGSDWMGRSLKVNKAKPREDRGSSGGDRRGSGGGGYSQRY
jgi:RNA recognition motif-containing protein